METNLTVIDIGQVIGGGRRREDIVCGGDLRPIAHQSLRREETEVCRAGIVAPSRAHLHSMEKQEGGEPGQFRRERSVQWGL